MIYDLHTHTTKSDGKYSPGELISLAETAGINVLAITDHDSVAGLEEAQQATIQKSISLVPGVELSVRWNNKNFHIVGLNIDAGNKLLNTSLDEHKQLRDIRALQIGDRLEKSGIPGAYNGAKQLAGDDAITRNHFARFLVAQGYAKNIRDVFKKFLVKNKPGYVKTRWMEMDEGITLINQSGGQAVLAHPLRYRLSGSWMMRLLDAFKQAGGNGIEIVSGHSTPNEISSVAGYARKFKLAGSIGSDFHGHENMERSLGNLDALPEDILPVWECW